MIAGTLFIVPYRLGGNTIQVLRVFHGPAAGPRDFEKSLSDRSDHESEPTAPKPQREMSPSGRRMEAVQAMLDAEVGRRNRDLGPLAP